MRRRLSMYWKQIKRRWMIHMIQMVQSEPGGPTHSIQGTLLRRWKMTALNSETLISLESKPTLLTGQPTFSGKAVSTTIWPKTLTWCSWKVTSVWLRAAMLNARPEVPVWQPLLSWTVSRWASFASTPFSCSSAPGDTDGEFAVSTAPSLLLASKSPSSCLLPSAFSAPTAWTCARYPWHPLTDQEVFGQCLMTGTPMSACGLHNSSSFLHSGLAVGAKFGKPIERAWIIKKANPFLEEN